ncbi:MAG: hypothetical protein AAF074_10400 [Pseudomonadota bacterium]
MIAIDLLLAILALAGFGGFLFIIVSFVPEPELILVVGVAVGMAVYDFLRDIVRNWRARTGRSE